MSDEGPESPGRRKLFTVVAVAASAALGTPLLGALGNLFLSPLRRRPKAEGVRADLGPLSTFEGAKEPLEVFYERTVEDGYLTRRVRDHAYVTVSPTGLVALSPTCSHLGCGVSWSTERKAFLCPCHGGVYGADGAVLAGPPPKPLERLPLVVEAGRVSLDLSKVGAA